jgi:hypothetical protein
MSDEKIAAERVSLMQYYLSWLRRQANFTGRFVYRNNACNGNFDARAADAGVERLVRAAGWEVMELFPFSTCRGVALMRDGLHFDRHFSALPPSDRPNLGELNIQGVQSFLNVLCNPVLFPSTTPNMS